MDRAERMAAFWLRSLRSRGWLVASHNDFTIEATGAIRVYWSFSRGNTFIEGDGASDEEALRECWEEHVRLDGESRAAA